MLTYCPDCGTKIKEGWVVCRGCAKPLGESAPMQYPAWALHPGNNTFCCQGSCITTSTSQMGWLFFNIFMNVATMAAFCACDLPYLTSHFTAAIPVFAALLFVVTMGLMASTSLSDPGIIPRGNHFETMQDDGETPMYVRNNSFTVHLVFVAFNCVRVCISGTRPTTYWARPSICSTAARASSTAHPAPRTAGYATTAWKGLYHFRLLFLI